MKVGGRNRRPEPSSGFCTVKGRPRRKSRSPLRPLSWGSGCQALPLSNAKGLCEPVTQGRGLGYIQDLTAPPSLPLPASVPHPDLLGMQSLRPYPPSLDHSDSLLLGSFSHLSNTTVPRRSASRSLANGLSELFITADTVNLELRAEISLSSGCLLPSPYPLFHLSCIAQF